MTTSHLRTRVDSAAIGASKCLVIRTSVHAGSLFRELMLRACSIRFKQCVLDTLQWTSIYPLIWNLNPDIFFIIITRTGDNLFFSQTVTKTGDDNLFFLFFLFLILRNITRTFTVSVGHSDKVVLPSLQESQCCHSIQNGRQRIAWTKKHTVQLKATAMGGLTREFLTLLMPLFFFSVKRLFPYIILVRAWVWVSYQTFLFSTYYARP
jgi:hypothetical protein